MQILFPFPVIYKNRRDLPRRFTAPSSALLYLLPGEGIGLLPAEDEDF